MLVADNQYQYIVVWASLLTCLSPLVFELVMGMGMVYLLLWRLQSHL